jgi:preprotein translocase subunit SecD
LLFNFGTGPIKGFAVTLSMGIVSSMFTAIMLTRFLIVIWLRHKRPSKLPI